LNSFDEARCKHCGGSLADAHVLTVARKREEKGFGWKVILGFLILIAAAGIIADPLDIVPLNFFDTFAILGLAIVAFMVLVLLEDREEWMEVRTYE
jgi:hypothetical protein